MTQELQIKWEIPVLEPTDLQVIHYQQIFPGLPQDRVIFPSPRAWVEGGLSLTPGPSGQI